MICLNAFVKDGIGHGCGQCILCRVNRRRVWVHRLLLEATGHAESSFVTLTYAEGSLPITGSCGSGIPTLVPEDLQKFLKRLRYFMRRIYPDWALRFYAVGEYGEEYGRPHYHLALFGFKGCVYGDSDLAPLQPCKCASCAILRRTWSLGIVHQGVVELKSMQYMAGYVVKGMTKENDERLRGRCPEFARMSLRPGIGGNAILCVSEAVGKYGLDEGRYAGTALRHGKRFLPLGRYLSERLRRELGREKNEYRQEELSALRAHADRVASDGRASKAYADLVYKKVIAEGGAEKARQVLARRKLFERGKK